jgi:hypothetical protein
MVLSMFPARMWAEDASGATWTKVELENITANDTVAVTMSKDNTTWVLPADTNTSGIPAAKTVTVSDTTLTTDSGNYGWKVTAVTGGYTFANSEGKYLYVINDNKGVRVGATEGVWSVVSNYLSCSDGTQARYMGVYNGQDWRSYKNTTTNIGGQTLAFWKLSGATAPTEPDDPGDEPGGDDPGDEPTDPDDPGSDEPTDPDKPGDPTDPGEPGDDPSDDPIDPSDPKVDVTGQARLVTLMNIRSEPSMNAAILGRLPAGSIVNILALEGNWLKIVWEGTEDGAAYVLYQDGKYAEMQ